MKKLSAAPKDFAKVVFYATDMREHAALAKMLGFEPVFCNVDPDTFNAGAEHIAEKVTDKTGAILATHLFGQPCPIREVAALAKERNIRLIEDCAHACGVRVGGQQVGTFGDIGVFSFAEGKNMPCFGGGGVIVPEEIKELEAYGVAKIYSPEDGAKMGLQGMIYNMIKQMDFSTVNKDDFDFSAL